MTSVSFMAANAKYCLLLDSKQSFCAASGSNNETVKHIEQLQQAWFQHICQRNNSTFSKYLDSVLLREFVSAFQEARKLMKDIGGMTKKLLFVLLFRTKWTLYVTFVVQCPHFCFGSVWTDSCCPCFLPVFLHSNVEACKLEKQGKDWENWHWWLFGRIIYHAR